MDLKETAIQIHENNKAKGFWDKKRNVGEMLMLVNSELCEALEADRENKYANRKGFEVDQENWNDENDPVRYKMDFERSIKNSFEDEIADAMIRLMDISVGLGIDLEWHIAAKMKYNSMRPHMHGKKY